MSTDIRGHEALHHHQQGDLQRSLDNLFSRAVCRGMGAAMFSRGRLRCFTISRLIACPDVGLSLIKPEDPFSPLFNAILYSMSWVRKLVKSLTGSTMRGENNYVHVYIYKFLFWRLQKMYMGLFVSTFVVFAFATAK